MKHSHPLDQTNLKKGFEHVDIQYSVVVSTLFWKRRPETALNLF